VLAAREASSPRADEALADLCQQYWAPLHAFVRAQGHTPEDAEDLTQAFFERLIAHRDLSSVDPARGRFRSFLLAALKHFLANARDHDRTLKRGGGYVHVPLDSSDGNTTSPEPTDGVNPEMLFEQQWLAAVIRRVSSQLEAETDESKRPLVRHLAGPITGQVEDVPLREVAGSLGMSEGAVRVALHRLRRRFRDLLREEIAHTVADPADVEDEIRHLFAVAARG
jgi:RNA polymerase sigma factor (sigma-70 family)